MSDDIKVIKADRIFAEIPPETEQVVILGQNTWGKGPNVPEAIKQYRSAGGSLKGGYIIYAFPAGLTSLYVDNFGAVCWEWGVDGEPVKPLGKFGIVGTNTTF